MRVLFFLFGTAFLIAAFGLGTGRIQERLNPRQKARGLRFAMWTVELLASPAGAPIEMSEVEVLERQRSKEIIWLDARPDDERAVSWIPGSRPAPGFASDMIKPDSQVVIVYDTMGTDALERAKTLNLDKRWRAVVRSLRGGTVAWAQAGRMFQGPRGLTKELRLSSPYWNLAPAGYKTSW